MAAGNMTPDDEEMLKKMAVRIRSLRMARGFANYEEFANKSNLNRVQYGRYEIGENLKYLSLDKVIKALNVTYKEFFSEGFDD